MAATPSGASLTQTSGLNQGYRYDVIGKNSEVFAVGDPVTITAGVALVAGTTNTVFGIAVKAQTMSATNATVAKVYPALLPVYPDQIFLMGTNADLTGNATDVGKYYQLTGTTGAVKVDVSNGVVGTTSRVVEIVKVDPFTEGGTGAGSGLRKVLVRFVKTGFSAMYTSGI